MIPNNRISLLWMRIGPYHAARLRALAAEVNGAGSSVCGVQVASRDLYEWAPVNNSGMVMRTIFPNADYNELSPYQIRRGVGTLLNELSPSVVGINGWSVPEARAALAWCRNNNRKAILFSETLSGSGLLSQARDVIKARIVKQFDAALVGGRLHKDYVVRLGLPANKVHLGYDVVENAHFSASKQLRDSAPIRGKAFLASGRFIKRKNLHGLLAAYAGYINEVSDPWRLLIAGSGEEDGRLRSLAVRLGIGAHVDWKGFVQYPDLPQLYADADCFIHPALHEPWGLVVNEACAAGLPLLLSSQTGAACELLQEGINGYTFDPKNRNAITGCMTRMHKLADVERRSMSDASIRIISDWGPERFAHGFIAAVESCGK